MFSVSGEKIEEEDRGDRGDSWNRRNCSRDEKVISADKFPCNGCLVTFSGKISSALSWQRLIRTVTA